jgi:hypothetical protein
MHHGRGLLFPQRIDGEPGTRRSASSTRIVGALPLE